MACFTVMFFFCWLEDTSIGAKDLLINDDIMAAEVRVTGSNGEALGVMKRGAALDLADKAGLDLVLIAPQGNPPVCKIMDYDKYRFEQNKREKELKKNQKQIELKGVRLSLNIDTGDFNTKVASALKFLSAGDKVKVTVRFRGREMAHPKLGDDLLNRFRDACAELSTAEKAGKFEGRNLNMVLQPKGAVKSAKQEESVGQGGQAKPAGQSSQAKPAGQGSQAKPAGQGGQAKPAGQGSQAKSAKTAKIEKSGSKASYVGGAKGHVDE
jgi:translation initiation factor IF-3